MNFEEIKKKLSEDYAENSVKSYFLSFRKIIKAVFNKTLDNITLENIKDVDKVRDFLSKIENLSVRKVLLNGYNKIVYHMNIPINKRNILDNYLSQIQKQESEKRTYAKPSQKEKDAKFEYSKISDKLKEIKKKIKYKKYQNITNYIKFLMLTMLKYLPPLRNEDYATSLIVTKDKPNLKEKNRLILSSKKWKITDFKTKKSIFEREFDVPDEIIQAIKRVREAFPDYKYVFSKITNVKKPASTQSVTNFLKRMLGGGVQLLRKIYISDMIDKGETAEERKKISNIMGHSAKTQILNYSKFSDVLHSDNKELNKAIYDFKKKFGKKKLLEILKETEEEN